ETCCAGSNCESGGECSGGHCVPCGAPGQPCCAGSCNGNAMCQGATCAGCGSAGQPCCPTGTPCNGSMLACIGNSCRACFAEVSAGGLHTCARRIDGTLWCWGYNYYGQLGHGPSNTNSPVPVQVLDSNGSAFADAAAVSAGSEHTCAVKHD